MAAENPNPQIPTHKQPPRGKEPTSKQEGGKPYDLEERTLLFAKAVRAFVKKLPRTVANIQDVRQLIDASGSAGANYIEANDALGRKDFMMRARIARKEAKESRYWLRLVYTGDKPELETERMALIQEANELRSILTAIIKKAQ